MKKNKINLGLNPNRRVFLLLTERPDPARLDFSEERIINYEINQLVNEIKKDYEDNYLIKN